MTAESEWVNRPVARAFPTPGQVVTGAVMCLFDGSDAALPRLRLAAASAAAAGRRLIVAHIEKPSAGFWAAAFSGYGACIGPAERFFSSTSEAAFAAAVEALVDAPVGWDFAACRAGKLRGLRDLAAAHDVAVVVTDGGRRLARKLSRTGTVTVLTV